MSKLTLSILFLLFFTNSYCQRQIITVDTLGADSLVQVFYQNGQLFFQITYVDGLQNGWYEQYHKNGMISGKDFRINGKTVDGVYVYLTDKGNIYQKGHFKNGVQVGKWFTYTETGEFFKIYFYNNKGELVKLKVWDDEKCKWKRSNLY